MTKASPPAPPLTAAQAFLGFAKAILASNATPEQVEASRIAFMGGVTFLLDQLEYYIAHPSTPEAEGEAYLNGMREEVNDFLVKLHAAPADPREQLGQMQYTTPDPDNIRRKLNEIGHGIGESLPPGYGFLLMMFNFGEGGNMFYISNGERHDMLKAMREFIQKNTQ